MIVGTSNEKKKLNVGQRYIFFSIFILYILLAKLLPSHSGDTEFWIYWANSLYLNDFTKIYSVTLGERLECNYPPIILYFIKLVLLFCDDVKEIVSKIYILKILTVFFDFSLIFFLTNRFYKDIKPSQLLLVLTNFSLLYNSLFWGQVDSVFIVFFIFSLFFLMDSWFFVSGIFLALSFYTKFQVIIFMPVFTFLFLYYLKFKFTFKIFNIFLGFFLASIVILIPFIFNGNVDEVFRIYLNSNGFYHNLSCNAHNIWYWISSKPELIDDRSFFFNLLSLNKLGISMYLFSLITFFCYFINQLNFKKLISVGNNMEFKLVFLLLSLTTLLFFYFNTQMHERYSFASLCFLNVYFFITKRTFLFIFNSIVYFLNIEGVGCIISKALGLVKENQHVDMVCEVISPRFELILCPEFFVSVLFFILIIFIFVEIKKQIRLVNLNTETL